MITYSLLSLVLASLLGFLLFMAFAWGEWRGITSTRMSFKQFITDDQPGFIIALLMAVASFVALPELASISYLREHLGFTPNTTPMSAMGASFVFATVGYQLRAMLFTWLHAKLAALLGAKS